MKKLAVLVILVLLAVAGGSYILLATEPIEQPIKFNHKLHTQENDIDCIDCHQYFDQQRFSGLPGVDVCMGCHEDALTESPEEEKIRTFAKEKREIPWNRIYDIPDHVYYSHRRHVVSGGLECVKCHGDIANSTQPPEAPLNKLTMEFCLDCHQKSGVSVDCIACHK